MLSPMAADPSPLTQAAVYMTGIFLGHAFLTPTEDLRRVWQAVRSVWTRHKD